MLKAKCDNGLIIGSDSQATNYSTETKKIDVRKFCADSMGDNRVHFIYAGAGEPLYCNLFISTLKSLYNQKYKKIEMQTTDEFADLCKESAEKINLKYEYQKEQGKIKNSHLDC